jgi:hypothetical protein
MTSLPTDPSSASHSNSLEMSKDTEGKEETNETHSSETVDDADKNCFSNLSNQVGNYFIFRGHLALDGLADALIISFILQSLPFVTCSSRVLCSAWLEFSS